MADIMDTVLAQTAIAGLDIPDALGRMGGSAKMYLRIIHSFVTNMPGNLEDLATEKINAETLPDYAIKIHGAKGSCYGIGANAVGDEAKALEMASKAGDLATCVRDNDAFIAHANELIAELAQLEARVEEAQNAGGGGPSQAAAPDTTKLAALLAATQCFDIDMMGRLVDELTAVQYASGGELVAAIKASYDAFDYQAVEEAIAAVL